MCALHGGALKVCGVVCLYYALCRREYINCHLCMAMVGALVVVEVEVLWFSKRGKLVWFSNIPCQRVQ